MKQALEQAITDCIQSIFSVNIGVELTRPDERFGDYATNVALQLAKIVDQTPREVAEQLVAALQETMKDRLSEIAIAGPGFINLTLNDASLIANMTTSVAQTMAGQSVVAEYSDPNPFKVLHAGHLYTTVTGDAIARLLEAAGAMVHRLNYGGDVGLHVGKTMWAIVQQLGGELPEKLAAVDADSRLEWLSARYVEGNTAYQDDAAAKTEIIAYNQQVYEVHAQADHTSAFAELYWTCRQWSYDGFIALYERLQVEPFERFVAESEVTPAGLEMVKKGLVDGIFEVSEGATVFKGEAYDLHTRVFLNSNGLPTYEAKELGLAAIKWQQYQFDSSLIITANDIVEYMKVLLKALEHFYPEAVARTSHLTHGIVKLPGAVKMSSREGNILRAVDILEAAAAANKKLTGQDANQQTVLAAVKYAFLKQRIGGDIVYDPSESVSLEGNSGPYLQYAHARARSILRKAQAAVPQTAAYDSIETEERSLVRKLGEYAETVDAAVATLLPHLICTYLYELAQTFNRFYEHTRVLGDPRQPQRLQLVEHYAQTLKTGLALLGVSAPEQM